MKTRAYSSIRIQGKQVLEEQDKLSQNILVVLIQLYKKNLEFRAPKWITKSDPREIASHLKERWL